jgi:GH35 family endo-1,4-beta-xylanase
VGAQSHDLDHPDITAAKMKSMVQKLHDDTGLDVYITEYDISTSDDAQQLALYQEHIPFFMETDYVKGVTLWGWIYGATWSQAPDSGLIRNGQPRPAMTWLMDTLNRPAP